MTGRHGAVRRRARLFRTGVMLVVSLGAGTVWAQEPGAPVADPVVPAAPVVGPGKPLHATRTPRPPTLDGRLDDAVWTAAVPDEHFLQFFPNHGKPVSERTQIRVLYDDTAIYVGVWLYDAEPEKIVARTTRRDREIESDHISIFFDSAHDHNTAYGFTLNAAGVLSDGLHHTDDDFNADWDAVWNGKTSRDADGWQAEFAIPLSALRFSSAPVQTWGFQAIRYISRKKEVSLWTLVPLEGRGVVSRAGHLEGLIGIRPRRTLEWRPFVVGRLTAQTPEGGLVLNTDSDLDGGLDAGFDVKFGITSDLTLDSTVNPDFSQVEVDEAVVNLTRFETFFPEKRPFFLEASPLFATPTQLFYSRRVGANLVETAPGDTLVDRSGEEVTVTAAPERRRIWNATKLTGKLSRKLSIGLFHALMDSEDVTVVSASGASRSQRLTPPHSYSVARARYGADGATYVGAMATAAFRLGGDVYRAEANHDDTVQSIDGQWQSSEGTWRTTGQLMLSERLGGPSHRTVAGTSCPSPASDPTCTPISTPEGTRIRPGDVGFAGLGGFERTGRHWLVGLQLGARSPTFNVNTLGFDPELNKQFAELRVRYLENQPSGPFQQFAITSLTTVAYDFAHVATGRSVGLEAQGIYRNFIEHVLGFRVTLPNSWDSYETGGDGARFERAARVDAQNIIKTDSRKWLVGELALLAGSAAKSGGRGATILGSVQARLSSRTELVLEGSATNDERMRALSCSSPTGEPCHVETPDRDYLFGTERFKQVSAALKGIHSFSPTLSIQAFSQLARINVGLADFRAVTTAGPRPFIAFDNLAPSGFTGDFDGDGAPDDPLVITSLLLNVIARWEPWPGSTFYGVYTRTQSVGQQTRERFVGLAQGPLEELFLIKAVLFL